MQSHGFGGDIVKIFAANGEAFEIGVLRLRDDFEEKLVWRVSMGEEGEMVRSIIDVVVNNGTMSRRMSGEIVC